MNVSINDYYQCPLTLNRLEQCGYLSRYLDAFATWLSNLKFSVLTIRKHISNVAHFSNCFAPEAIDLEKMDDFINVFLQIHLKQCRCQGWKRPKNIKQLSYSLNRFKHFLADSCGLQSSRQNFRWQLRFICYRNDYCVVRSNNRPEITFTNFDYSLRF